MKLGIAMLVIGLIFAGFGFFLWNWAGSAGPLTPGLFGARWFASQGAANMCKAIGMGVTVFGGGLTIGGIVRMIITRRR